MKRTRTLLAGPLLLTVLLVGCGGEDSSPTAPVPGPMPTPQPGTVSSVSGVLSFPGAQTPISGTVRTNSQPGVLPLLHSDSWWLSAAEVRARQERHGLPATGIVPGEYIIRRQAAGGQTTADLTGGSSQGTTVRSAPPSPSTLSAAGVTLRLKRQLGLPGLALYRADAPSGLSALKVSSMVQALNQLPGVLSAEPNRWMHALATPNDKLFALQWDAQAMNLPAAWDTSTGRAVTVGVIDTGIVRHPDLMASTLPGLDLYSDGSGTKYDLDPTDEGGGTEFHGSHVSGTVAAATNNAQGIAGVSWAAKIVPVRVLGPDGGSLADILLGTLWAAGYDLTEYGLPLNAHPATVLNLSLGGSGPCSSAEQQVFDDLAQRSVITVVAAGNDNQDAKNASPGNCSNVITVGATGPDGMRAPYSNFGARIDVMAPGGDSTQKIRIGTTELPGGILSTVADEANPDSFGYTLLDGTSMAAPHVAGLIALLKGEQSNLTTAQAVARLKATSTPLSAAACRVSGGCGAGLVNAAAALKGTVSPVPTPVPAPTPVGAIKTYVAALYALPQGGYDEGLSHIGVLSPKTLHEAYSITGLTSGTYQVAAWQDLNGNEDVDTGEPFGLYVDPRTSKPGVTVDAVSRSIVGIDLQLKPYQAQVTGASGLSQEQRELQPDLGKKAKSARFD